MEDKKKTVKKGAAPTSSKKKSAKGKSTAASTKGTMGATAKKVATGKKKPVSRAQKPAHKALPFVFFALALFLGACLYLNLFCNPGNSLTDPSDHWVGLVGYYICYGIFGTFGPAALTLPLLLINLAVYWKKFVENRVAPLKLVATLGFLISLCSIIHVFGVLMMNNGNNYPAEEIWTYGTQMLGGGIVGSTVGYFLFDLCSYVGSLIILFLALGGSLFYLLGMTPQYLWSRIKEARDARPARPAKEKRVRDEEDDEEEYVEEDEEVVPVEDAPAPRERAPKAEKKETPESTERKEDAVPPPAKKKKESEPVAPKLDPGREDDVFVPVGVDRRMAESSDEGRYADYDAFHAGLRARQEASDVASNAASRTANSASNRDSAADRVFPSTGDAKGMRRGARADGTLEVEEIFEDDTPKAHATRSHAPVPPEVPMYGGEQKAVVSADAAPAPEKPAKKAAKKETMTDADRIAPTDQEYGLSNEEFEDMEASGEDATTVKRRRKKTAVTEDEGVSHVLDDAAEAAAAQTEEKKPYELPPISFLHQSEPMSEENVAELRANISALGETLKNFRVGIQGNIRYSYGPTVTRYELTPAPGVRVKNITNLSDDIALALRASGGIRMEAPIPGTNTVGIEIPNKTRSTIYLRELLESRAFVDSRATLAAALGAGIAGEPLVFDIAKMPHLLIAGTTGSGKSVCINCIVLSLLYRTTPDDVRLVMIDPKKVEFSPYKNIPHLLAPIVTLPKDAAGALQASVDEMERRFEYFENVGVRDLKGYREATADDPDMPKFPHIVIIIDELADLMMTARDEVETAICRIAQKARAAGMHLIIGTQRPSADIVTGLIKANVPSRIAFAVKSQIDSRVILDHIGAEALAGKGDMLFVPIGSMRDTRVQGAFVDDKEVEAVCDFLRSTNGLAVYDEHFIAKLKELAAQCGNRGKGGGGGGGMDAADGGGAADGSDDKYADAVRIAMEEKCIATSRLQRKLGIGYGRAAKLIDRMEQEGIVSASNGSKPRTVLISTEEYMRRFFGEEDGGAEGGE